MLKKVLGYIQKYNMLEPGDRVVVGVSGGADSLALIHLLGEIRKEIPLSLVIAHINHGLRDEAAREDALFVESIAKEWGIKFFLKEVQVLKLSKEWGVSEEQAGRRVRYEFFEEVRLWVHGQKIALAHHRDDQAETILHNIIRGTGLAGLSGMKPVRDGIIIRPLLGISRREIEEYCHDNGLRYRDDHTNEEIIYTRNRIRHMVIPMIEEHFNPNFSNGLVRMGDILRDEEEFLLHYSREVFEKIAHHRNNEVKISLSDFNKCPKAIKGRVIRRAFEILKKNLMGIEYVHIDGIMDLALDSKVGSILNLPQGLKVRRDYFYLVLFMDEAFKPILDFDYELDIPGKVIISQLNMEISIKEVESFSVLDKGDRCIYIDADSVSGKLCVRNRRKGDRFKPLGMTGTKKLKDFFIDNKIPRLERGSIPLVVDRDNIIWIAGYQMSENYKVTKNTRRLFKLEIKNIQPPTSSF